MTEQAERYEIECRSYTHARRHPFVIGTIGGWHLPSPMTPTQLLVLLGSLLGFYFTRGIWGIFGGLNLFIMIGIPMFLTWSIRHMRMEGRAPVRMLVGYMTYVFHPNSGIIHGKSNKDAPKQLLHHSHIYMVNFPLGWEGDTEYPIFPTIALDEPAPKKAQKRKAQKKKKAKVSAAVAATTQPVEDPAAEIIPTPVTDDIVDDVAVIEDAPVGKYARTEAVGKYGKKTS